LAQQRQQEQAFQQMLPQLLEQSMGPDGQPDMAKFSSLLMQTPGGLKPGMDLRRAEEDRAMRVQQGQAMIEQRTQQAAQMHEARMAQAQTAAERAAETARHNEFMRNMAAQTRALTAAVAGGRSSGDDRREPMTFSVDGKNVQGWRDRFGNVFGPDGRAVQGYQPQITSADQAAEQKRASEAETKATIEDMINRIDRIAKSNPGTVAGPWATVRNGMNFLWNNLGGAGSGSAQMSPNQRAEQLRDSMISGFQNLGRLSVSDRERLERIWGLGVFGSPAAVAEAVQQTRQIINSKYAGSEIPTARGAPRTPEPKLPDGFKWDQ
jgi:hypothetical protein